MARRYGETIIVLTQQGLPATLVWRQVTYHVRVIGSWRLTTRWWEAHHAVDRTYFRVETSDHQIFEVYRETAGNAQGERWVLDICLD